MFNIVTKENFGLLAAKWKTLTRLIVVESYTGNVFSEIATYGRNCESIPQSLNFEDFG